MADDGKTTTNDTTTYHSTGKVISKTADFMRKYQVVIYKHTTKSKNGVKYPNSNETVEQFTRAQTTDKVLDVSQLRCVFDIKRYAMYYPNSATIQIYNLTAGTETDIMNEGYRVIVYAGYEKSATDTNYGQIFDGDILMCSREKQNGTDYILTILAMDGSFMYQEGYANFTLDRGATARDVVKNIVNKASVKIDAQDKNISKVLEKKKYSKSKTVHGLVRNTLNDICKELNCTWFIDNGKLYILSYAEDSSYLPNGKAAIELNVKTGLLGNVKQVNQGVEAKCLLNPQIVPFSMVRIESYLITRQLPTIGTYSQGTSLTYKVDSKGLYRVISVNHHGDTRGNDWYTYITAYTQSAGIPELLTSSGDSMGGD